MLKTLKKLINSSIYKKEILQENKLSMILWNTENQSDGSMPRESKKIYRNLVIEWF